MSSLVVYVYGAPFSNSATIAAEVPQIYKSALYREDAHHTSVQNALRIAHTVVVEANATENPVYHDADDNVAPMLRIFLSLSFEESLRRAKQSGQGLSEFRTEVWPRHVEQTRLLLSTATPLLVLDAEAPASAVAALIASKARQARTILKDSPTTETLLPVTVLSSAAAAVVVTQGSAAAVSIEMDRLSALRRLARRRDPSAPIPTTADECLRIVDECLQTYDPDSQTKSVRKVFPPGSIQERIAACLWGFMLGDALGKPFKNARNCKAVLSAAASSSGTPPPLPPIRCTGKISDFLPARLFRGGMREGVPGEISANTEWMLAGLHVLLHHGCYNASAAIDMTSLHLEWASVRSEELETDVSKNVGDLLKSRSLKMYTNAVTELCKKCNGRTSVTNEALARCLFVSLLADAKKRREAVILDVNITHPHPRYIHQVSLLLADTDAKKGRKTDILTPGDKRRKADILTTGDKRPEAVDLEVNIALPLPHPPCIQIEVAFVEMMHHLLQGDYARAEQSVSGWFSTMQSDTWYAQRTLPCLDEGGGGGRRGTTEDAFYCAVGALRYGTDFVSTVKLVVKMRGDACTNAALAGAVMGARLGAAQLLSDRLVNDNLHDVFHADPTRGDLGFFAPGHALHPSVVAPMFVEKLAHVLGQTAPPTPPVAPLASFLRPLVVAAPAATKRKAVTTERTKTHAQRTGAKKQCVSPPPVTTIVSP